MSIMMGTSGLMWRLRIKVDTSKPVADDTEREPTAGDALDDVLTLEASWAAAGSTTVLRL